MDLNDIYAHKARVYARSRWEYAPGALEAVITTTGLGQGFAVADIGAGPGSLAKHFLEHAGRVIMVEPSPAMRQEAAARFGNHPAAQILDGRAEATGLADADIDLIGVGQAIHYFEADAARREFVRILKPGGWLAVLRNYGTDEHLNAAIEEVYTEENGCDPAVILNRPAWKAMSFYFGGENFQKLVFPFQDVKTRADYIEALETASYAPHAGHPLYPRFAAAAGRVFDQFSRAGVLYTPAETELYLGQIQP